MGKKKGKKQTDDSGEPDDITAGTLTVQGGDEPVPVVAQKGGGGKKGKKKKKFDEDDIDAELMAMANEDTPNSEPLSTSNPPMTKGAVSIDPPPITKSTVTSDPPVVSSKPPAVSSNPPVVSSNPPVVTSDPPVTKGTVSKGAIAIDPPVVSSDPPVSKGAVSMDPPVESSDPPMSSGAVSINPVTVTEVADEVEEEDDKDKKKKKKKKKTEKEEDKKAAAKTKKGKPVVKKIHKELEALREAQRKREEEEEAKRRAEEEAERKRLEEIQREKERKELKKQKEKEKKERLKKEGKWLTKSEKEKRARANVHLQALVAQGILVPQKGDGEGRKGPVRYGSKPKKQKPQDSQENDSTIDEGISSISEVASTVTEEEGDDVKDNWDDEEEEEDEDEDVKDTWEDEEEEEEELTPTVSSASVLEATPTTVPADSEEEEEEESEEESGSSDSDSSESDNDTSTPFDKAVKRIKERRTRHYNERSPDHLRSPVVCVLGHVDTGKTKILDKIRHSNVQDGEAGGITQQIGATFVPLEAIQDQTKMIKEFQKTELKVPGLLIIDTPGHESFSNLRTRGSSMCDIAILVVDIMHGLEPQTIESLNLLRKGNVPFVVALNKIDRLYNWVRNPTGGIRDTLRRQKPNTKAEFDERVQSVVLQFAEQGVNAALYWDKVDFTEYIAMVPTSAHSGDGMGDLISLIVTHSQQYLSESLMFCKEVEAIVLEVKVISGYGTTIDVILRNGVLNEGDTLVLSGTEGPIVTQARALLMPEVMKELRVKNTYRNHKSITASQGVKITGKDLEKVLAGMPLLVATEPDEIDVLKEEASSTMSSILNTFKLTERGVYVQASTLGSLEALVEFLKTSKIPYAGVNIGPVHKKDVMKASVMLEKDNQWACILAFDVRVEREAQEMADSLGVRIFTADIIYHLFDSFMKYREELREKKRRENEHIAIFPCKLKILPNCVFNARNPIIVGVSIIDGVIKSGTPLVVPSKDFVHLGTVSSIEVNHKPVDIARKGSEVCIKIEPTSGEAPKLFGRHFDYEDIIMSKISRESIDAVKNYFRDDLQKSDWKLIVELKKIFQVY